MFLLSLRLLAVYFGATVLFLGLTHGWISRVRWPAALFLALAPFLLVGRAMLTAGVYAPLDIAYAAEPLASYAAQYGVTHPSTPLLSDVISYALPARKAVREAVKHGRIPLWNRFDMGGTPLLAAQQPAALHPATWIGFLLPLPQAWTFEMAFRIFLALAAAYLYFRDLDVGERASLFGASAWAFSDFLVFWRGYAVGAAISIFPLLLLGLRQLARDADRRAVCACVAALLLITLSGHPEALLHTVAAGGIYFLFELASARSGRRLRAVGLALAAGAVTLGLCAVVLLPFGEIVPQTSAWLDRLGRPAGPPEAVSLAESLRWSARNILPYAFGVSGHGKLAGYFGLPAAYGGALLFPLAALGLASRRRERWAFVTLAAIGLALWAQLAGVSPLVGRLPLIGMTLLHYFVFLGAFAVVAAAVLGFERLARGEARSSFSVAAVAALAGIAALFALVRPELLALEMRPADLSRRILLQLVPLVLSAAAVLLLSPVRAAGALLVLLLGARGLETSEVYPTFRARAFFPVPEVLARLPRDAGERVVGIRYTLPPNLSALYEIQDVRGYESMVLAAMRETFPLWCVEQFSWFNRVDDASRPFLSFLAVRYAIGTLGVPAPAGWSTVAQARGGSLFENPRFLPKAFAPARFIRLASPRAQLAALGRIEDFAAAGVLEEGSGRESAPTWVANGSASVTVLSDVGQNLRLSVEAREETLIATSVPRWPGWKATVDGRRVPTLAYNRAFIAFRVPAGRHDVWLSYLPDGFLLGLGVSAVTLLSVALGLRRPSRRAPQEGAEPRPAEIDGAYQHRARREGFVVQRFWHYQKELVVRRLCPPSPGDRVLDVGCGSGVVSHLLASLGGRTTGIDSSETAVAYATATFACHGLDFRLGRVEDLDFADGSVDRVYAFELIEHLSEPQVRQVLSRLRRFVRPGGTLLVTTPNYRGPWVLLEWLLDRTGLAAPMARHQHITRFSRSRLARVLSETGWRTERLSTFSTFAPFLSLLGWQLAERCADLEERLALPFGNLLVAVARRPAEAGVPAHTRG